MQSRIVAQIVVPCLNEELAIPAFLAEANRLREASQGIEFNFIFVDNGSTDQSFNLLNLHCKNFERDQLIPCQDVGYGAALKAGFRHTTTPLIGFVDLDCTYPLISFTELYKKMAGDADVAIAIANRMTRQSKMPLLRAIGNYFYRLIIRVVYGPNLSDVCSGMRLFKRSLLREILSLENNGLGFSIELTCCMLMQKWKFSFSDINYQERQGRSKLNIITDGLEFLKQIFESRNRSYEKLEI
jgi:glycosyltransferase involved in cell wall biosynthesis